MGCVGYGLCLSSSGCALRVSAIALAVVACLRWHRCDMSVLHIVAVLVGEEWLTSFRGAFDILTTSTVDSEDRDCE